MFKSYASEGRGYTIPMVDLSVKPDGLDCKYDSLFKQAIIDNATDYMAHPDAVLLKSGKLMAMYPEGHGKGNVVARISEDGGLTWSERIKDTPKSWQTSRETPTVYRLQFNNGSEKVVMISGNPTWGKPFAGDGFNACFSNDDGNTWTEFEKFYGKKSEYYISPMVAMASLTRLKDNKGQWRDAWMGVCHDGGFHNYKTILTFEDGKMKWSMPEKYLAAHRIYEKKFAICEVEVIRSECGAGKQLCLIARCNGHNRNKANNSIVSFSDDEGVTWTTPRELPAAISGERHKAEWLHDGRLFVTFRAIDRDPAKLKISAEVCGKGKGVWFSEGWIAWVGTYDDLVKGNEGQYRIKLAHTYLKPDAKPSLAANADTGYCGNAVLDDGRVFTSTYGTFGEICKGGDGTKLKTYIVGKTLDIALVDELSKR